MQHTPYRSFRRVVAKPEATFRATQAWQANDKTGPSELGHLPRHFWKIGQVLTRISNSERIGYC
jgi:hypothetical protein